MGSLQPGEPQHTRQTPQEIEEERLKIRRLQWTVNLVVSTICQDPTVDVEEAAQMAAELKQFALALFPDKELAYDLIYKPRVQRVMNERYRMQ